MCTAVTSTRESYNMQLAGKNHTWQPNVWLKKGSQLLCGITYFFKNKTECTGVIRFILGAGRLSIITPEMQANVNEIKTLRWRRMMRSTATN